MRNSTVTANAAENQGGGIYVAGLNSINQSSGTESQAYLKNVTISDNDAGNGGGGIDVEGQAIMRGVVTNNIGGRFGGGGILLDDDGAFYPSLSASDLTVSGNQALGGGGGIANYGSFALTGGVIGASSNANGNTSQSPGGGLFNNQVATLDNVAVQHNKAQYGGGIENDDRVLITGGSLSGNHAIDGGGLDNYQAQAVLNGVKVAANHATDQAGGLANVGNFGSLSVTGGSITGNKAPFNGGGIYSFQPTTVDGTSIKGNTARKADGGGIYSQGSLTLTRVQLGTTARPNEAQLGGGLYTQNIGATVVRSTIEGNRAQDLGNGAGGGIFNTSQATDELRQSTVTGNTSDGAGGGIMNYGAVMVIYRSTLSGNAVLVYGGAISNMPDTESESGPVPATLTMQNDTVTGNLAGSGNQAGFGGGLLNESGATLTNVTISRNRASSPTGGGGIANDGTAALRGTILAANTGGHAPSNCDVLAPLESNGYNLDNDGTCGLNGVGDQTGVNPKLGPLANNGGPTQTEALKAAARPSTPSSSARHPRPTNAASSAKAPATSAPTSACPTSSEEGVPRGGWAPISAQPPATAGRIVTSSPSETSVSRPSRKRMSSPPT